MSAYPMRCGRLDRHEPHEWTRPLYANAYESTVPARTYQCVGHVITEMERTRFDAEDDAAEDRADRERRETA